jgi:hypothetical protein
MTNPFKDWDESKAAEHNQRVANRKAVSRTTVSADELVAGKRVRQSHKQPNKLEAEWGKIILSQYQSQYPRHPRPRYNAKAYLIANGLRFTPDWTASYWDGRVETAWEVKGPRAWDGALDKLKMAATAWPEVRWILVWKEMGQWQSQEILP